MLFAYRCQLCCQATEQPYICEACYQDLPRSPEATALLVKQQNPELDQVVCPYLYEPPLSSFIQQLKYHKHYSHSRLLAYLFYRRLAETYAYDANHRGYPRPCYGMQPDAELNDTELNVDISAQTPSVLPAHMIPQWIVPIPLYYKKLWAKGFNQSFELAKFICATLGLRHLLNHKICQRVVDTPSQTGLNKRERRKNLHKVFWVNKDKCCQHITLLDDVVTTGSTACSLAKAFKASGVKRVDLWAIAFAELR